MHLARFILTTCKCKYFMYYVVQNSCCSNSTQVCTSSHGKIDVTSDTLRTNSEHPPPDDGQKPPSAK
ncbi:hypothetical protein COCC4DRAFT_33325 [Bipolaris maydis ATCC 48331]|uniref:Uncharacterized protein n=2 Tax=Cochliobolus heterostrophus TaxID=5016 RepID=M2UVU2_COCH5|nr:uncharacterized protein COCC4DRAFT_33325 [Bipolaris maydis ATCC 48331]EMD97686.1 hypothetical protein COCHEDRAFT_1019044 [Bipolaris maydis C5]ENI02919.1 hypothetical protein COCC4DRAFT_33325 [Bipolaris maydis ATCC 48331]